MMTRDGSNERGEAEFTQFGNFIKISNKIMRRLVERSKLESIALLSESFVRFRNVRRYVYPMMSMMMITNKQKCTFI